MKNPGVSEVLFMCSALLVDVAGVVPVESDVVHVLITVSAAIANFREVWISKSLVIHVIEDKLGCAAVTPRGSFFVRG